MAETAEELTMAKLYQLLKDSQEEQTRKIAQEIQKSSERTKLDFNKLEKRCENLERAKRKNNIVSFGINPTENLLSSTLIEINRLLELSLREEDINNIYYVGKKRESRGMVVEFISYLKKISIFKNIKNLKGTKVAIANDLNPEDKKINKILLKHLKQAKGKNLTARIKGSYLEIEGRKYTVQELPNWIVTL